MALKFVRPINAGANNPNVSTPFGPNHPGIDYAYPEGTNIYASEDGEVIIAKGSEQRQWLANKPGDPYYIANKTRSLKTEDYGNFIKIQHADTYSTLYAHLKYNSLSVKVGDKVKKGQLIAQVGSTGNSSGNHTHWETRKGDQTFDPSSMFDSKFSSYSNNVPASQIAVDASVFPGLVHGSTEWDETVEEYKPGADPKKTLFEDVKSVINGKLSQITSLIRENSELRIEKDKALIEVNNRIEQISRLNKQVIEGTQREESLVLQLKKLKENPSEIEGVYKKQLEGKQVELDNMSKAKGEAEILAAEYKAKYEASERGVSTRSLFEIGTSLVRKLIPFLKKTKI